MNLIREKLKNCLEKLDREIKKILYTAFLLILCLIVLETSIYIMDDLSIENLQKDLDGNYSTNIVQKDTWDTGLLNPKEVKESLS